MQSIHHNIIEKRILKMKESEQNCLTINDGQLNNLNINKILFKIMWEVVERESLELLDLSNNLINGVIEWNLLSYFTDLKALNLNNNRFTSHNDEINWKLLPDSLEILQLSKNINLKGKIIWEELPKNLQLLDISETSIICEIGWNEINKTNLDEICISHEVPPSLRSDPLPPNWSKIMTEDKICFIKEIMAKDKIPEDHYELI